ncbi:TetR/AcrR family transcriptional regulator [Bacillus atrophaeus]|uniref:TetR/AcrR family transcriptional regulator n=1 Tax=Bacillus atrophaeus TaxID=1452 RepID=UPI00227E14FB|nr:TetR/AcrR family transcriptional regulator [Bacillus atrophaeus]MCY8522905.1 TetR/AcrR family transcriptional regulator [Bacillus atrophaeus]MCY8524244.1 TetR/AcrR family transcriptional regulator [Bacillus atrophaeus]MDL5141507.1 TetR/AcrR family transcriptional regulator [Bacillus atrophaeus]
MSKKEEIFEAAAKTITEKGLKHLTLSRVAKEANMTKAGLLYHFSSKEELINEMNEYAISNFQNLLDHHQENLQSDKAVFVKSFVLATLDDLELQNTVQLCTSMLATMSFNEELLKPWRTFYTEFKKKADEEISDPATSHLIRLVCDGIWFSEMFQLEPLQQKEKALLLKRLMNVIEEDFI